MGNLTSIQDFLVNHVLIIVLIVVGVIIATRAHKADNAKVLQTVGCVFLALLVIGIAVTLGVGDDRDVDAASGHHLMDLKNDDCILTGIDSRFLGPRGRTLPFAARYSAWGSACVLLFVSVAVLHIAGFSFSINSGAFALFVAVVATSLIHRRIDGERPLRTVFQIFWSELTAERPPAGARVQMVASVHRVSKVG